MLTSTEHISESYHNQCHELEGRITRCVQGCLEDLEVSDIMTTDVISVRPDDSVYSAMDLMVARSVSGLPVTGACCRLLRAVHARETSAPPSPPPAHATARLVVRGSRHQEGSSWFRSHLIAFCKLRDDRLDATQIGWQAM